MDAMDEFREALRKAGAPEGWPEDAPMHKVNGFSEQNDDGDWVTKFRCLECGWERHFVGDDILMVHEGNKWAFHSGSIGFLEITGISVTDPYIDVFENYLDDLDKEND